MEKQNLQKIIDTAAGRVPADLLVSGAKIADVYSGTFADRDIAICGGVIAGIAERGKFSYAGKHVVDAGGKYILPGLIDGHIHVESSYLSPQEFGALLAPRGCTTAISDPHEVVNICGLAGLDYMINAAKNTALDIRFNMSSCVPCTPFDHSGFVLKAADMEKHIQAENCPGLGEFMDYPGVISANGDALDKILLAYKYNKVIDGHSPAVYDKNLNAYIAAGINTDHECQNALDLLQRVERGMYVMLREGSACHDLRNLLKAVTKANSRFCILCSDDLQAAAILNTGHLDNHLRICVENGIDAITAIQMATINAAACYRLYDRGGIAPGLRADFIIVDNVKDFNVEQTYIGGALVAANGKYLLPIEKCDDISMRASFHVKGFTKDSLKLKLSADDVYTIDVSPGTVVTGKGKAAIRRGSDGNFIFDTNADIAKIAVIERHHNTGNTGLALIRGYGIKHGAIALSIAHDSHNIISVGTNDDDMYTAINRLISNEGGIVLCNNGTIVEELPLPLGGVMSDKTGTFVAERLQAVHKAAYGILGVNARLEPVMSLCFMSLAVIPELKITDTGLIDVAAFSHISVER